MNTMKCAISILIFYLSSSCGDSNVIRIDKEILNGWDLEESIKFEISDTIDFSSNIFFYLRNNNEYPFSNIFLIASLKSNQKVYETDTLEYMMADSKGEWLQDSLGLKSKLRERNWNQILPPYIFEIKQANRKIGQIKADKKLYGIYPLAYQLKISK